MCELKHKNVVDQIELAYDIVADELKNYLENPEKMPYFVFRVPPNADEHDARVAVYNYFMGLFRGAIHLYLDYDYEDYPEDEFLSIADSEMKHRAKMIRDLVFKIPKTKINKILEETKPIRKKSKTSL